MSEHNFVGYCGNQIGSHQCIYRRHEGDHGDGKVSWSDAPVQESEESWQAAAAMHRITPVTTAAEMLHTTDARVWAKGFVEHVKENPAIASDEHTMATWFANAIMAGRAGAVREIGACQPMKT